MRKTGFKQAEREGRKELLHEFKKTIGEEQRKLEYLKEAVTSVKKWNNNRVYKIFLKDALIKLDRVNDQRLDLQSELMEEAVPEEEIITEEFE